MTIGDKVIFIDNRNLDGPDPVPMPIVGNVYVIRSFGICSNTGKPYLRLIGVTCELSEIDPGVERGLWAWRFRTLDEMKQQAELTKTLLNPLIKNL